MKNEVRMSLMFVLSALSLIALGSIENVESFVVVWFIGVFGLGGAFALSLGSLIHMQLMKCKG